MKIVHVCSYFNTSSLYKNFFESLSEHDLTQEVFIPLYINKEISPIDYGTVRKREENSLNIKYHYIECLKKIDRFLLVTRTKKLFRIMVQNVEIDNKTILHAHSLFANGGICYFTKLHKKCEYIVAVRETDLIVYKKLWIYRNLAKLILKESKMVVFISYALKKKFLDTVEDLEIRELLDKKSIVIPNGLNKRWFEKEITTSKNTIKEEVKFLYQGTLHKRKNVNYIIKIVEELNLEGINSKLEIVGGGPEKENIIRQIQKSRFRNKISISNWTNKFDEIVSNYKRNNIYIMPSANETFGIAYLEALAVGLPIIYKENDGVDGFFDNNNVGTSITTTNLEQDIEKIKEIIYKFDEISRKTMGAVNSFSWNKISESYIKLYQ